MGDRMEGMFGHVLVNRVSNVQKVLERRSMRRGCLVMRMIKVAT